MAIAKHKTRRRELQEGRTLARRVQRGDRRAFELLYASYEGGLFRFCYRLTGSSGKASALVEATFAHALAELPADGLDTVDVAAHLYATARSLSYRRPAGNNGHASGNGNGGPPPAAGEHATEVVAANARLAPRQRMALALRDLEGAPDDEIALALGAEPPAVPALVARARLRLRAELALPGTAAECDGYLADLSAYADGTLPAERRATVEAHLQECADCRAALFALQEAAQRYRAVPVPVPPGELSARMAAAVGAAGLPERPAPAAVVAASAPAAPAIAQGGRQTAAAIVMAAIVVIGVVVTILVRDSGSKAHRLPSAQTVGGAAAQQPLTSPPAAKTTPAAIAPAATAPATTAKVPAATAPAAATGGPFTPPKQHHARSGTLVFPHESTPVTPAATTTAAKGPAVETRAFPTTTARTTPAAPSTPPQPLAAPKGERQIPVEILPPSPPPSTPAPANASPSSPSSPDPSQTTTT